MKIKILLFIIISCFANPILTMGVSIVGGDLTYQALGNNQYLVNLKLIRDCSGIMLSPNVQLDVNSISCASTLTFTMNQLPGGPRDLSPCPIYQTTCVGGTYFGAQIGEYTAVVSVPSNCPDWIFSIAYFGRADSLTTILPNQGFYLEAALNNAGQENNSTVFASNAFFYSCKDQMQFYNQGTIDIDGDSVVYYFVDVRGNGNTAVNYNPGYSGQNPMTSNPAAIIDHHTGDVSFNSPIRQFAVIGIRIDEYRNGALIGYTERNVAVYIDSCPPNFPPALISTITSPIYIEANVLSCFTFFSNDSDIGDTVTMVSNSGAIPGSVFTVTGSPYPTGTFCWTPSDSDTSAGPFNLIITLRDQSCPNNNISSYPVQFYVTPFTGINEPEKEYSVYIFEDKVNGRYIINSGSIEVDQFKVYNNTGALIIEQKNLKYFELNGSPPGIYFVEIQTNRGKIVRRVLNIED